MAAVRSGKEDREDGLGHVDKTGDICLEHDPLYHVVSAKNNSRIVNKNIDVPPLFGQVVYDTLHFGRVANIKLERKDLNAITDFALDLLGKLLEGVNTARSENET
ncbi:hypothetical protein HG531_000417 [Fusarium graminearum]|nr:hypothetical protein HG531_000417 [Fusarium graminearum]